MGRDGMLYNQANTEDLDDIVKLEDVINLFDDGELEVEDLEGEDNNDPSVFPPNYSDIKNLQDSQTPVSEIVFDDLLFDMDDTVESEAVDGEVSKGIVKIKDNKIDFEASVDILDDTENHKKKLKSLPKKVKPQVFDTTDAESFSDELNSSKKRSDPGKARKFQQSEAEETSNSDTLETCKSDDKFENCFDNDDGWGDGPEVTDNHSKGDIKKIITCIVIVLVVTITLFCTSKFLKQKKTEKTEGQDIVQDSGNKSSEADTVFESSKILTNNILDYDPKLYKDTISINKFIDWKGGAVLPKFCGHAKHLDKEVEFVVNLDDYNKFKNGVELTISYNVVRIDGALSVVNIKLAPELETVK